MRAFLLYVTHQAELGHADQLKEHTIGVEVLGRKPDYDPAKDNIVRVRANELRSRLARYFASEGTQEHIAITIPRGGYAPEFILREAHPAEISEQTRTAPASSASAETIRGWRWLLPALAIAFVVAVGSIAMRYESRSRSQLVTEGSNGLLRDFWTPFFAKPAGMLTIIYSDSGIALWQRLNNKDINLGDYLSHKYLDSPSTELLEIASQRATSPADIATSLRIQGIASELDGQVTAQFARNVNAELLHRTNLVLIGSRHSNPWVEIYEPNLNFQLHIDPQTQSPNFLNHSPKPGEAPTYAIPDLREKGGNANRQFIEEAEEKEYPSYGVIALLKECGTKRSVLLLEGLNMQATQAAGDLVTDSQMLEQLLKSTGQTGLNVSPFEVLFQVTSLPGGYENPKVIATRVQPAGACFSN